MGSAASRAPPAASNGARVRAAPPGTEALPAKAVEASGDADGAPKRAARGCCGGSGSAHGPLDRAYSKVAAALCPLFMLAVALSAIDRNNLSYASITLIPALGLTPSQYGLGSSLFYITYVIFLIPSGLAVPHLGERRLLAGLLVAWGAVATCMAAAQNVGAFYALRLLLGAAEAGALPCMWAAIMRFHSKARLPRPFSYLYAGIALSGILGGPLATGLLALDGHGGLHGYQWLFILEGIPAVLLGALVFFLLPDQPSQVRGLTPPEAAALEADLAANAAAAEERRATVPWRLVVMVLRGRYFPLLAMINFLAGIVSSAFVFWSPLIIFALLQGTSLTPAAAAGAKSAAASLPAVGLSAVPFAVAGVAVLVAAAHAQRRKEIFYHAAIPLLIGGAITVAFPWMAMAHPALGFASLVVCLACSLAANPAITSVMAGLNRGPQEVVALPLLDGVMTIGAVLGAPLSGLIVQHTASGFKWVTIGMGVLILVAASLILVLRAWAARGPSASDVMLGPSGGEGAPDGGREGVGGEHVVNIAAAASGAASGKA